MRNALVIDADNAARAQVRTILERLGLHVYDSPNGEEALRVAEKVPVALAVADMRAVTKDGVEVIRTFERRFAQIKMIALTGSALAHASEFESVVNGLGVERLFTKPIDALTLSRAVAELLLGRHQSPAPLQSRTREQTSTWPSSHPSFMLPSHSNRLQVPTSPLGGTAA